VNNFLIPMNAARQPNRMNCRMTIDPSMRQAIIAGQAAEPNCHRQTTSASRRGMGKKPSPILIFNFLGTWHTACSSSMQANLSH